MRLTGLVLDLLLEFRCNMESLFQTPRSPSEAERVVVDHLAFGMLTSKYNMYVDDPEVIGELGELAVAEQVPFPVHYAQYALEAIHVVMKDVRLAAWQRLPDHYYVRLVSLLLEHDRQVWDAAMSRTQV